MSALVIARLGNAFVGTEEVVHGISRKACWHPRLNVFNTRLGASPSSEDIWEGREFHDSSLEESAEKSLCPGDVRWFHKPGLERVWKRGAGVSGARQMLGSCSESARVYIQNMRRGMAKDHWSSKNDARVQCVRVLQDVMVRPRPRLGLSGPTLVSRSHNVLTGGSFSCER